MQTKYSIYFKHKSVVISTLQGLKNKPDLTIEPTNSFETAWGKIKQFEQNPNKEHLFIATNSPDVIYNNFASHFCLVPAAGGLVINPKGEILVIYKRGLLDFPKGKIDAGEKPKEAAIREVEEECGLKNLLIIEKLPSTFHIYDKKSCLKETHWYAMEITDMQEPIPQVEEGITSAEWMKIENLEKAIGQTYPSLRDLIHYYLDHKIHLK